MCIMLCRLQMAEGMTRLHHLQSIIIPVPMLSSAARCFELFAVSSSLLHAHNPGCFLSVFRTVSCLYTTPIKVCVRRTCCMLGTTLPAGGYSTSLCKLQMTMVPHIDPEGIFQTYNFQVWHHPTKNHSLLTHRIPTNAWSIISLEYTHVACLQLIFRCVNASL